MADEMSEDARPSLSQLVDANQLLQLVDELQLTLRHERAALAVETLRKKQAQREVGIVEVRRSFLSPSGSSGAISLQEQLRHATEHGTNLERQLQGVSTSTQQQVRLRARVCSCACSRI